MNQCPTQALTFLPDENGATVAEYAAIAALVAVAIIGRGTDIDVVFDKVFTFVCSALDYMIPALSTAIRLILSFLSLVL
jgi:Flp pilus assembly pilin Flp